MLSETEAALRRLPELRTHARADLDLRRTSIDPLARLGARWGIDLWVKRDDTLPLAMGGNKVRQLEYYLGPALEQGADTLLITGAIQSNFVRLAAAAARRLGWQAHVQLEQRVPRDDSIYNTSGNVLLNKLFGAEIHYFNEGENEAAADANLDRIASRLQQQGRHPYVVHLGTEHPPLGALGYALCAAECYDQCQSEGQSPDHIVIPSGSGLTHAGYLAGARAIGWQIPVHGICVRRNAGLQHSRIEQRYRETLALLGKQTPVAADDIRVDDNVLPPGYGQLNDAVRDAMQHCAEDEALLLDPVYSGRTMAGVKSLIEQGVIQHNDSVLFIHTGGLPALFAYQHDLTPADI